MIRNKTSRLNIKTSGTEGQSGAKRTSELNKMYSFYVHTQNTDSVGNRHRTMGLQMIQTSTASIICMFPRRLGMFHKTLAPNHVFYIILYPPKLKNLESNPNRVNQTGIEIENR